MIINVIDVNIINEALKLLVYPTENDNIKWKDTENGIYETGFQGKKFKIWEDWPRRCFKVDEMRIYDFDKSLYKVLYKAVKQNVKRVDAQAEKHKVVEKEKELRKTLLELQALQKKEVLNKSEEKDT